MKKSTKIILPALAVLVLGTAAAATGTVAWFAANGVVSATGMQVKCATSKNLLIANTDPDNPTGTFSEAAGAYGASVATTNTGLKTLEPSSTSQTAIKTPNFYVVKDHIGAVAGEIKDEAKIVAADGVKDGDDYNRYYAEHNFWVASSATANMSLSVKTLTVSFQKEKADGTGDTSTDTASYVISRALRVGIVYHDSVANSDVVKIYTVAKAADEGDTRTYQGLMGAAESATIDNGVVKSGSTAISETVNAVYAPSVIDSSASKMDSLGSIKSTTSAVDDAADYEWTTLKVYVWYEGQDPACTANNALSVEHVSVSLSFQADEIKAKA